MKKIRLIFFLLIVLMVLTISVSAQTIDVNKLPKYVVVGVIDGGFFDNFKSDIKVKENSSFKFNDELLKLEKILEKTNTMTEMLNRMDDLGFDFVDSSETKGGNFQHLIFRKQK